VINPLLALRRDPAFAENYRPHIRCDAESLAQVVSLAHALRPDAMELVDLAAGTGAAGLALSGRWPGAKLTAVDADANMLYKAEELRIYDRMLVASAESLPIDDSSIDLVVCMSAFHLFADKRKALAELRRVLRSDGLAVIGVHLPNDLKSQLFHQLLPRFSCGELATHPNRRQLRGMVLSAGFTVESVTRSEFAVAFTSPRELQTFLETRPFCGMASLPEAHVEQDLAHMSRALAGVRGPLESVSAITSFFLKPRLAGP
jgi:SAM-dependent methyltransferase